MISQIEGELIEVENGRAYLRCGGLVYEILVPAADTTQLSASLHQTICLHTLHLIEGTSQGTNFRPRLIGFTTASDRAFFELFTTVRGIGSRKALRVMELPVGRIALAVAEGDVALLKTLPEVGKRTAETIIVELKEKVSPFVEFASGSNAASGNGVRDDTTLPEFANEALAVLQQLGEPRLRAEQLMRRALDVDPELNDAKGCVTAALRLKQLA